MVREYKESSEADENIDISPELVLSEEELAELPFSDSEENEFNDDDVETLFVDAAAAKKAKAQQAKTFSLQARRAIEERLEQRRLRKELDYLFDDSFANSDSDDSKK